jgi:hypothetical protein
MGKSVPDKIDTVDGQPPAGQPGIEEAKELTRNATSRI